MRAVLQGSALCATAKQARAAHVAPRRLIVAQGERQQQDETSTLQAAPALSVPPAPSVPVRPPQRRPLPQYPELQVARVEQLGESRFSGVVALDSGSALSNWWRVALLVGGDVVALLLFASIGRVSHGEALSLGTAFGTAWPFIAGWLVSAALLDGYGKAAQGGNTGVAAGVAAKTWALGIPAGQLIRAASRGYLADPSFLTVSMATTSVLLIGWRSALAAATPEAQEPQTRVEQLRAHQNRQGNLLEMLQMVLSMVKRW